MALIITLILLSVVTFMALAFLALSRRERSAVATVTDTAGAQYAADAALANAEAQIMANVLTTTNPFNFGLLVSTNAWPVSFTNISDLTNLAINPRAPVYIPNPTNPSQPSDFRYYLDLNRNGTNDPNGLQFVISSDPANPYYYFNPTNSSDPKNGLTMPSIKPDLTATNMMVGDPEWIGVLERPDAPYGPNNKFIARYAFIAVPVGNTLDLNAIHNQVYDEPFGAPSPPIKIYPAADEFFRNQGVGSWELNLAGFLADLNTNEWGQIIGPGGIYYVYNQANPTPPSPPPNTGFAFEDAQALLAWRYNNDYSTLNSPSFMYANSQLAFQFDNIDGYSDGPLQTGFQLPFENDVPSRLWSGADNTNHYFTPSELFDPTKTEMTVAQPPAAPGFIERLKQAGTNVSTYDRYTFYRLLSQLGTDSTPESGKMNLNYDNLDGVVVVSRTPLGTLVTNVITPPSTTNFYGWTNAAQFFTNAADRMLRTYTKRWLDSNPTNYAVTFNLAVTNASPFGLTRIPVLVSNQFVYSPAVQRVLQLAANLYDATTNKTPVLGMNYPSVFRPTFAITNDNGFRNIYINGFVDVSQYALLNPLTPGTAPLDLPVDAADTTLRPLIQNAPIGTIQGNVYGVPWIIGAKKGFPSFNKFTMQNVVQITRKLQIARSTIPTTSIADLIFTNQLYVFSVSNSIGVDCWNSYSANYANPVQIVIQGNLSMRITNDFPGSPDQHFYNVPYGTNLSVNPWPGSAWSLTTPNSSPSTISFIAPFTNLTYVLLTNSDFYFGGMPPGSSYLGFYPDGLNLGWETNKHDFTFPQFGLLTTNRLQLFILSGNNVIDYLQYSGPDSSRNLNAEVQTNAGFADYANTWSTNLNGNGVPWGVISQIEAADGDLTLDANYWSAPEASDEIDGFFVFMGGSPSAMPYPVNNINVVQSIATNYIVQVPYTPTITAYEYTSWQANDPLVHYLTSDLNFIGTESGGKGPRTGVNRLFRPKDTIPRPLFNALNERYQPWGRNTQMAGTANVDTSPTGLAFKDPLVRMSDDWNFPTNKLPNIGWIGRVHRGTPWQSVYLKATDILSETNASGNIGINTWATWTGNFNPTNTTYTAPVQDRVLFDLFTTAFNDNATRGTLSVNQDHLAAWSALFSGMVALSNNAPEGIKLQKSPQYQASLTTYTNLLIQPAGPNNNFTPSPALLQIVQGINNTRANTNLFPLQVFTHVGDILSVPQLTEQSPFLNRGTGSQLTNGISDEMYEWLPQQAMSLLRVSTSPRYVIYSYGQTLKPAPDGIYSGGGALFGMITNYQIVSEFATRAVVRVDSYLTNIVSNVLDGNGNLVPVVTTVLTNNRAVIEQFNVLPPD